MSRLVLPLLLVTRLAPAQVAPAPVASAPVAQDCVEQDATVCGRQHFERGTQAFEKGDFVGAAAEFRAAMAQRPHPVIRFNLALSLARLGQPTAAIEQLQQVQTDAEADQELRGRAAKEQHSAEQALARVTFKLSDPTRELVELDGKGVKLAADQELALDPGSHHVRVISGSSVVLDQELELSPGERVELRVGERSRRIDVVVVPDAASPKPVQHTAPPQAKPVGLAPGWFYASAAATLLLTGVTVWSGIDTKRAYSDYQQDLPHLDQSEADERVRDGHARELRTNLLLAGSVLCGASTAVLGIWFVDFSGKQSASVSLLPSGVALSGRF